MASQGPDQDEQLNIPKDASRDNLEATLVETGAVSAEKVNAALDRIRSTTHERVRAASEVELSAEQAELLKKLEA